MDSFCLGSLISLENSRILPDSSDGETAISNKKQPKPHHKISYKILP